MPLEKYYGTYLEKRLNHSYHNPEGNYNKNHHALDFLLSNLVEQDVKVLLVGSQYNRFQDWLQVNGIMSINRLPSTRKENLIFTLLIIHGKRIGSTMIFPTLPILATLPIARGARGVVFSLIDSFTIRKGNHDD